MENELNKLGITILEKWNKTTKVRTTHYFRFKINGVDLCVSESEHKQGFNTYALSSLEKYYYFGYSKELCLKEVERLWKENSTN